MEGETREESAPHLRADVTGAGDHPHGPLRATATYGSWRESQERLSSLTQQPRCATVNPPKGIDRESQLAEGELIKVVVDGDDGGVDMQQFHEQIDIALRLRTKYKSPVSLADVAAAAMAVNAFSPRTNRVKIDVEEGVYRVSGHEVELLPTPTWTKFAEDVQRLRQIASHSGCIRACSHRLGILQERSRMFFLLNAQMEEKHNLHRAGGVFASVTKVDSSVTLSKSVDAQELLDYVVDSCSRQPDAPVKLRNGSNSTLRELMYTNGVSDPDLLSVEGLGWQPRLSNGAGISDSYHSPDQNPLGAELRFAFLSVFGSLSPRLLRRNFDRVQAAHQAAEYAVPLYGSSAMEVASLAKAIQCNNLGPYPHIRWTLLIRVMQRPPSGYQVTCRTLQDQLDNIFLPILKATVAPTAPENVAVAWLLEQVGALQLEGLLDGAEKEFNPNARLPEKVYYPSNLNSLYYLYYLYANLAVVNALRASHGLNTLQLRCSGNHRTGIDDMLAGYLLCDMVNRATKLRDYPVVQYLCGMQDVALSVSPVADNMEGATPYQKHPLANFLHRCLAVSIATEAPLLYHHNPNALVEEYATSQKIFRLSALDMTELARNSVVASTFPASTKRLWLGDPFLRGVNQFSSSQVTDVRLNFREESWQLERNMMRDLYLNRVSEQPAGLSRWHYLSNVRQAEYNTVLDRRVRFPRTVLSGPAVGRGGSANGGGGSSDSAAQTAAAAAQVARALALRHKYQWVPPRPWEEGNLSHRRHGREAGGGGGGQGHKNSSSNTDSHGSGAAGPFLADSSGVEADFQRQRGSFNEDEWTYAANDGVFIGYPSNVVHAWPRTLPTLSDYHKDLRELMAICSSPEVKEFAHARLENLDHKFYLHLALNHANEAGTTAERVSSNRDIYQATKIDTHIHMAAGMTPKQMLDFVLKKFRDNGDDIAMKKGDEILTLGQLFAKAGITENLTVDQLSVQADHTLFERFDNFNNKYNPMENGDLRSLLLKTDNFMNGRYFAEIIHDVFSLYSRDRYTYAENRVSVYGINIKEWDKLASWFTTHGMANRHNKWIIQVPRVYKVFRSQNVIGSFGQYLQNIFEPLWEASLHPAEYPTLHNFLKHVSGFDSVDNEASIDLPFNPVSPWAWTSVENPPYNYYLYYLYANIRTLNEFRASRGFNTFSMRPHCGESGSDEHLYGAFLCANAVAHGINLRNDSPMQYLYYLAQIGLHVSPLSNNALFLRFLSNPFPDFFRRGLNVSLSTDDPMMFHQTQEPLIEEYSIAARVWGLSPNDLCEIARNSVLQCGFNSEFKKEAIGDTWFLSSSQGNDPLRTHLSDIRVAYRFETYHTEVQHLEQCCHQRVHRYMLTADEERDIDVQVQVPVGNVEEIIMSTHDQEMEVVLRDIEGMQDTMTTTRVHVDILRRQEKSLVDNITEVGTRRQELLEELQHQLNQETKLQYTRSTNGGGSGADGTSAAPFKSNEELLAERALHWRTMPPNTQKFVKQVQFNPAKTRALPPL